MNINHSNEMPPGHGEPPADTIDLIDLLVIVARWKHVIFGLPLCAGILAILVSFLLPVQYASNIKLLPPQQAQSATAAMLSQLGGVAAAVSGVAGVKNPNDIYIGMLKSRTIADHLINRFDLHAAYSAESKEEARRLLAEKTNIVAGKDGIISIDVEDSDKQRAPKIATAYVDELVRLTKVLAVTEASKRRMFFEQQLMLAKNQLAAAEIDLKKGLDTRGVISVDGESRAVVETIGMLRARISAKEIELNSISAFVTPNNQDFKRIQQELLSLRGELGRLEDGAPASAAKRSSNKDAKTSGFENIRLLRDVKYHQMLYELLGKNYELARLEEAKDASIIQVLDLATVPEKKSKPNRGKLALVAAMVSFIAAIVFAFSIEYARQSHNAPSQVARWTELRTALRWR